MHPPVNEELPVISCLWVGPRLRWYDKLGLASFRRQGHRTKLYSYAPVENLPDGVESADARDIFDPDDDLVRDTAPSYIADIFRIHLMEKTDEIWCDSDLICVKPITVPDHGFVVGATGADDQINNAVMRLPRDSGSHRMLLDAVTEPDFVPPWLRQRGQRRIAELPQDRKLIGMYQVRRIVLGPMALTHALSEAGDLRHAAPMEVFSPVYWTFADLPFNPRPGMEYWITEDTCTVHLWSSLLRKHHKVTPPEPTSFVGAQMAALGIDFEAPD